MGELLCAGCRSRLHRLLDELAEGFARLVDLDHTAARPGPRAGRGMPGFGSRSPARDDVLDLIVAPRSLIVGRVGDPDNARNAPLLGVLGHWADRAREDGIVGRLRGPRTVLGEQLRLTGVLDELARAWWVADMLADLTAAAVRVRRALDELRPQVPLGHCPRPAPGREAIAAELGPRLFALAQLTADDADEGELHCGGQVRAALDEASARCGRCRYRWEGRRALAGLGQLLGDALLDLPELAAYFGVEVATLRKRASRDGWRRQREGGRTVYSLADAWATAARLDEIVLQVDEPLRDLDAVLDTVLDIELGAAA